jgi:hypothetical protein
MDEKDDQIAHHRILAGREIPTNYGRNNNSPATGTHGSVLACENFATEVVCDLYDAGYVKYVTKESVPYVRDIVAKMPPGAGTHEFPALQISDSGRQLVQRNFAGA